MSESCSNNCSKCSSEWGECTEPQSLLKNTMNIAYTDDKKFTQTQVQELFLSVGWVSGQYPTRLHKALMHSATVITAWDGDRLVGLVRLLDDTEMVAYMHYVLVNPAYHGLGIASHMIEMAKEKYKNYLYIEIMPEESKNAEFYQKYGFRLMEDGVAMQLCNFSDRDKKSAAKTAIQGVN